MTDIDLSLGCSYDSPRKALLRLCHEYQLQSIRTEVRITTGLITPPVRKARNLAITKRLEPYTSTELLLSQALR